ncbi:MAG: hypothetical protein HY329_00760 [Chloroflexi bacterium]|nr:hypothetical protein [Chloroflexota bacterium]
MTTEQVLNQLLSEVRQREREYHELRLWTERCANLVGRALLKRDEKEALVDRLGTIGAYSVAAQRELLALLRDLEAHMNPIA